MSLALPADREAAYLRDVRRATDDEMAMARLLQKAAFSDLETKPDRMEEDPINFIPAPVYLAIAIALHRNIVYRSDLISMVGVMAFPKEEIS